MRGASAVTKNRLKICKMPLIILLMPKIIGLKNMMRISAAVISFFSGENPGAIRETRNGAKMMKMRQTTIKKTRKIFNRVEAYFQASSSEFTKYELNIGIMAEEMAPNTKISAIKSGMVNAA